MLHVQLLQTYSVASSLLRSRHLHGHLLRQWPVLSARSNDELLEALGPIKAKFVDIRSL